MRNIDQMLEQRKQTRETLRRFNEAAIAVHGSYAYSAGYMESVLAEALSNLSKLDRESVLKDLAKQTERLQKEVDKQTA